MLAEWIQQDYQPRNRAEAHAALRQVMQQVALASLFRAGFFEHAAFYGGTALRIFYQLPRFSEDLDFSLLKPNADFSIEPYVRALERECQSLGIMVTTRSKKKKKGSQIRSAFLNSSTRIRELLLKTDRYQPGRKEEISVKIKFEIDVDPPEGFATEERLLLKPFSCYIKCFTPEYLMAGKMHALLFRRWKTRVKGRDWYDFEWYIRQAIPVNLSHLSQRAIHSGGWTAGRAMGKEDLMSLLKQRIREVDFDQARSDAIRFISDPSALQLWSRDYFLDLIRLLKIKG
jgi:predicted nucleotidyltransferase component of viral defense system